MPCHGCAGLVVLLVEHRGERRLGTSTVTGDRPAEQADGVPGGLAHEVDRPRLDTPSKEPGGFQSRPASSSHAWSIHAVVAAGDGAHRGPVHAQVPAELGDDGSQRLHRVALEHEVGRVPALAAHLERLADLLDGADAGVRVGLELLGRQPEQRRHHLGGALAVVGDDAGELEHVDLEVGVAVAGGLAHPRDLLVGLVGGAVLGGGGVDVPAVDRRVDADDLRLAGGDRQHPLGAAADEERRRRLHRLGLPVVAR